ncbi:MAG: esterase/lipase family protein [Acidimicrobiales bacterium]
MVVRIGDVAFAGQRPTDLVVVVPGLLGSRLARRDGSGKESEIWGTGPLRLAKNLAPFVGAIKGLALPADCDPDDPGDGVVATGVITDLAVFPGFLGVAGYDGLIQRFEADLLPGQVTAFPYDWRLSSRVNGKAFAGYLERAVADWRKLSNNRAARAIVVAHSMGGLVSRWAIEKEGAHEHVSRLVTLGTPYRGAAKALDALANGLRLPKRVGPRLDSVVQSLPSVR